MFLRKAMVSDHWSGGKVDNSQRDTGSHYISCALIDIEECISGSGNKPEFKSRSPRKKLVKLTLHGKSTSHLSKARFLLSKI